MTKKMVQVVDSTTSKAEEIGSLRKMAECAGQGSYLSSLFTPELVEWVEGQIEMDLPPDIMECLGYQQERTGKFMAANHTLRTELSDAARKAGWVAKEKEGQHKRELDRAYRDGDKGMAHGRYWHLEAQTARAGIEAYRDSLLWAWGWVGWLLVKRDEAERLVEQTKVKAFTMLEKALLGKPQEDGDEEV